ncbi:hypothetical protein RCC89_06430 [Cytophagaceae bacterium ABcell3]|nr:hypothetical protein RCC89_06430 [Cytophagaceae bacterium ABcell3]
MLKIIFPSIAILGLIGCKGREFSVYVIVEPSAEECDDYNVIWRVDSIINEKEELMNKFVYLLNSKQEYEETTKGKKFLLKGIFIDKVLKSDFTNCGKVFRFKDESIIPLAKERYLDLQSSHLLSESELTE